MMFGRRAPPQRIADALRVEHVDAAFDAAAAKAREFGKEAAGQITEAWRAGNIDQSGVDAWVSMALEQCAHNAGGIPTVILRQILATLHSTIRTDLASAGIDIPELPA